MKKISLSNKIAILVLIVTVIGILITYISSNKGKFKTQIVETTNQSSSGKYSPNITNTKGNVELNINDK